MHPLDIPMAESGGPFRPTSAATWSLAARLCKLLYHPDERLESVSIDQPSTAGEILPIAGASKLFILPGIARDTSCCCDVRDECCSRATCASTPHGPR
jgi:hypothetical protein